jgi:serralysin
MRIQGKLSNGRTRKTIETLEARTLFAAVATVMIDNGGVVPPGHDDHGGHGGGDYQLGNRWSQTATDGFTGAPGTPITLTWGFVADGLSIPSGAGEATAPSILQARLTTLYGTMTAAKAVFQQIFDRWSVLTGITYVYTGLSDDGAAFVSSPGVLGVRPDVRIGGHHIDGSNNILAYNYFPNSSDMVVDTDELTGSGYMTNTSNSSRRLRNVLAHEHGHGLGFEHVMPVSQTKLMEPFVTTAFDGPQYDDILAAQTYYGDPLEKNGRNETPATATDKGALANGAITLATGVSTSTDDLDYFKFTVAQNSVGTFTLSPAGTTYLQGAQDGPAPTAFASGAQADLTLSVYGANGTSLLRTSNTTFAGSSETITGLGLAAGTYYIRVTGNGSTQMYQLSATIGGGNPPPVPSAPVLAAASDTGVSASDFITNDATPTFSGTATPGTTITLFADAEIVGTTTTTAGGAWTVTASTVVDGLHAFVASASTPTGTSEPSGSINVTIDTVAPAITVTYDHEYTQHLSLAFNDVGAANLMTIDDAVLTQTTAPSGPLTPAPVVPLSILSVADDVVTLGAGSIFANGRFLLSIAAGAITDVAGNSMAAPVSFTFSHLNGDATNNGKVEFFDLIQLSQSYGLSGKTFSLGNFDYDPEGKVDFNDLVILAQNYNVTLPALVQPLTAAIAVVGTGEKTEKTLSKKKPSSDVLA